MTDQQNRMLYIAAAWWYYGWSYGSIERNYHILAELAPSSDWSYLTFDEPVYKDDWTALHFPRFWASKEDIEGEPYWYPERWENWLSQMGVALPYIGLGLH